MYVYIKYLYNSLDVRQIYLFKCPGWTKYYNIRNVINNQVAAILHPPAILICCCSETEKDRPIVRGMLMG